MNCTIYEGGGNKVACRDGRGGRSRGLSWGSSVLSQFSYYFGRCMPSAYALSIRSLHRIK